MQTYATRPYRGPDDLAGLAAVINARMDAEGRREPHDRGGAGAAVRAPHELRPCHRHPRGGGEGTMVGHARTTWQDVAEGYRQYWVVAESRPDHPRLLNDLYDWVESRAIAIAGTHPAG